MNVLRYIFSLACFSAAFGMTIFWCYKFWKDEDLCLVDYKSFESSIDVDYPMLSLCLVDPFIESKLKVYNESFNVTNYKNYLYGEESYHGMDNISFNDVTLDLVDFYNADFNVFRDGRAVMRSYPNTINVAPKLTFVGATYIGFCKCFGLRLRNKTIKFGSFMFNSTIISDLSQRKLATFLHLPNQILLSADSLKYTWPKRYEKKGFTMDFTVTQMEVLRRRNKRTSSCLSNSIPFDEKFMNEHAKKNGCRAPFQTYPKELPICATKEEIAEASLDPLLMDDDISPCTSVRNIIYSYEEKDNDGKDYDKWPDDLWIDIGFPNKFKEIKQKKGSRHANSHW